jgi:hypothetical protein
MDVVSISIEHPRLMRKISCLGMEDSLFKTREDSLQHPSIIFDDMSVNDVALDMQDMLTVASDPTDSGVDPFDAQIVSTVNPTSLPPLKSRRSKTSRSSFNDPKDTARRQGCEGYSGGVIFDEHDQNHQSTQSLTVDDLIEVRYPASHNSSPRGCGSRRGRQGDECSRDVSLPALEVTTFVQQKSIKSQSSDRERIETFHESLCSLMSSSQSLSLCTSDDIQNSSNVEYSPPRQGQDFGGSNSDVLILMTISRSLTEQLSLSKESFTNTPSRLGSSECRIRTHTGSRGSPTPSVGDTSARAVLPLYQPPAPGTTERVVAYERRALPSLGELFLYP